MRDFSWKYFTMTGDVDAYLLYKQAGEPISDASRLPVEDEETYDEEAQ
ncbi:YqzL family protein [Paenibacillus sp. sgz500958]